MTDHSSHADIKLRLENLKPKDVKALVQGQGKMIEGNKEIILKEPLSTDSALQALINGPDFEMKSIGNQIKNEEMYFDLRSKDRQVRIKVVCHKMT
jgi:hypothetical protein